ncbi:MAG: hypothetical protein HUU38_03785 [Anaerolineales bacterium]|nr:hypothetical protein [Anaerolineales bacterium]
MHIPLSSNAPLPLWEGDLELPETPKSFRGEDGVRATIGSPEQWADGQLMGDKWHPPVGGRRYHVVRLAFTLRPRGRYTVVTEATFCLHLTAQGTQRAFISDAFPRAQTVELKDSVKFGLGPAFKIGTIEAELASAEVTFDAGVVIPVVTVEGIQEPELCWRYRAHDKFPLTGSRIMHAIVSLPPETPRALATLSLSVVQQDKLGPLPLGVPMNEQAKLQFAIGGRKS